MDGGERRYGVWGGDAGAGHFGDIRPAVNVLVGANPDIEIEDGALRPDFGMELIFMLFQAPTFWGAGTSARNWADV